jgi:hypothetical protein
MANIVEAGTPSASSIRWLRRAQICTGPSIPLTRYWAAVSSWATATRRRAPEFSASDR